MNIALIGLGMVASTHVAAIADARGLSLHGVLGRDPDKAAAFAQKVGCDRVYRNVQEICADPKVDFALIATPPDARQDLVQALAAAGKPILMEKPVERTLAAARNIVKTCEKANVPLGIVFQHRARAVSQALKDRLTQGDLGQIETVELRVPWWRDQTYYDAPGRGSFARDGGGAMINQAIHTLDLALWLLGPMATVQALMHTTTLHQMEAEDWAGALFTLESGAVGTLMATTTSFPGGAESIHIMGTKGAARLEAGALHLTFLDGRTETLGATSGTGGGADPMAFTHAWHQSVIDAMERASKSGHRTEVPLT